MGTSCYDPNVRLLGPAINFIDSRIPISKVAPQCTLIINTFNLQRSSVPIIYAYNNTYLLR